MVSKTITVTILQNGPMCAIPVSFDSKAVFGAIRAPVRVTLNGYTFRSTIASMGGQLFVPLRKSNREAAAVNGGDTVKVKIEADLEERKVVAPPDLVAALESNPTAKKSWPKLSYTRQREYVESIENAKKPETRMRRIDKIVKEV